MLSLRLLTPLLLTTTALFVNALVASSTSRDLAGGNSTGPRPFTYVDFAYPSPSSLECDWRSSEKDVEPRFPFSLTNGHISLNASRAVTDVRILYTSDDNGDPSVSTYLLPAIPKIDQNGTVCLSAVNFSSSAVLDQADGARPAVGSNFTIYPRYKLVNAEVRSPTTTCIRITLVDDKDYVAPASCKTSGAALSHGAPSMFGAFVVILLAAVF